MGPSAVPQTGGDAATRTLVIWCADWPVLALGHRSDKPAAVLEGNRVLAATAAARQEGVVVGMRRRDAQGHCPDMEILDRDRDREARAFEVVVASASSFTPWVEQSRPGSCALPTRGPSRYFGGDQALARAVRARVLEALGSSRHRPGSMPGSGAGASSGTSGTDDSPNSGGEWGGFVGVGVADGAFAAALAARSGTGCVVVEPGCSAPFLAPMPLEVLGQPDLVDVLQRLGLQRLGELAGLSPASVLGRFGRVGERARRLARGGDDQPLDARPPPADLSVTLEFDPPVERIDQAAFAAKMLADRLGQVLDDAGWSALRVAVEAETCHGEQLLRFWRHEGGLTPAAMAERVRWQLEGWLVGCHPPGVRTSGSAEPQGSADLGSDSHGPTGGLSLLRLIPDQVVPATGRQLGFWGGQSEATERATRAVVRVAAMLGTAAVQVVEPNGGRNPHEQFRLVAATAVDLQEREDQAPSAGGGGGGSGGSVAPWPGRLPIPSPSVVLVDQSRRPARLLDMQDQPVRVSGRGVLHPEPGRLWVEGWSTWRPVQAWAGPWPLEERWWDPSHRRRQARVQVVLEDLSAWLVVLEEGRWWVAGAYD